MTVKEILAFHGVRYGTFCRKLGITAATLNRVNAGQPGFPSTIGNIIRVLHELTGKWYTEEELGLVRSGYIRKPKQQEDDQIL